MKKKNNFFSMISMVLVLLIFNLGVAFAEAGSGGTDPQCQSGGPGATSCTIAYSGGVTGGGAINFNVSGDCEVSCGSGYYACCYVNGFLPFFHCVCKSNGGQTE